MSISLPHKTASTKQPGAQGVVSVWDLARLRPNPLNPRGELDKNDPGIQALAESIRSKGLLEPLLILVDGTVVAGHRRRLACRIAGVDRVRVIVQQMTEQEQLEVMLVENIQREDLTLLQEARGYRALIKTGLSQQDVVRRTGLPVTRVSQGLALLTLAPQVQEQISGALLPMGAIKLLAENQDQEQQVLWADRAIGARWTVEQLRAAIRGDKAKGSTKQRITPLNAGTGSAVLTRERALQSLRKNRGWPFKLALLESALDQTPCSCTGMDQAKQSKFCSSCPLARLLEVLVRSAHDAVTT
jgi:ParB family chromosome partitioning protein